MKTKLVRTPGLYLVGFMGCGKTTVGRLLADNLGWAFVDLDDDIEASARTTISEIFTSQGEEAFRRMEHEALQRRVRQIECGHPTVLSLGGGAFAQAENFELVEDNGISIWLDCPLEEIQHRIAGETHRPLAKEPQRFEDLYAARREVYARADFRIDAGGMNADQVVAAISSLPIFYSS